MGNRLSGTAPTDDRSATVPMYPGRRHPSANSYSPCTRPGSAPIPLRRISSSTATGPSTLNQLDTRRTSSTPARAASAGTWWQSRPTRRPRTRCQSTIRCCRSRWPTCVELVGGVEAADLGGPDERLRLPVRYENRSNDSTTASKRATGSPPASATACSERVSRSIIVRSSSPAAVTSPGRIGGDRGRAPTGLAVKAISRTDVPW